MARKQRLTAIQAEHLASLYMNGFTLADLAAESGMSVNGVGHLLRRQGVVLRKTTARAAPCTVEHCAACGQRLPRKPLPLPAGQPTNTN